MEVDKWFFSLNRMRFDGRGGFGPAWHGIGNPTSEWIWEVKDGGVSILVIFLYLVFAFGVITARRRRISTFVLGTVVALGVFSNLRGMNDPGWVVGNAKLISTYCLFNSSMFVWADLHVKFGLTAYNVTYRAINPDANSLNDSVTHHNDNELLFFYNERFHLTHNPLEPMHQDFLEALERGMPNPILVVAEYMCTEGFPFGPPMARAGWYTQAALITAFTSVVLCVLLLIIIPHYGHLTFVMTGSLQLLAIVIYYTNLPYLEDRPLYVEGTPLAFYFGYPFYLVLVSGCLHLVTGLFCIVLVRAGKFRSISTFFEVNYNTPFTDKVLVEHSEMMRRESTVNFARLKSRMHRVRLSIREFSKHQKQQIVKTLSNNSLRSIGRRRASVASTTNLDPESWDLPASFDPISHGFVFDHELGSRPSLASKHSAGSIKSSGSIQSRSARSSMRRGMPRSHSLSEESDPGLLMRMSPLEDIVEVLSPERSRNVSSNVTQVSSDVTQVSGDVSCETNVTQIEVHANPCVTLSDEEDVFSQNNAETIGRKGDAIVALDSNYFPQSPSGSLRSQSSTGTLTIAIS